MSDYIWSLASLMGDPTLWVILSGLLVLAYFFVRKKFPKNKNYMKAFLLVLIPSLTASLLVTLAIKSLFFVPRPCIDLQFCLTDSSFPSGHAVTSFTVFTSLFLVFRKKKILPIFVIPALVAVSRLILGVHTVFDLLGGFLIGVLIPLFIYRIEKYRLKSIKSL